jgi:hypothetical protein
MEINEWISQNTFSYVIKMVPRFLLKSVITGVTVSGVRKQWE